MAIATFAAGCFWGIESAFQQTKGVIKTTVGYTGGHYKNPTYKDVCSGKTGHAESVQVEYDPTLVSYDDLLKVFWSIHNPTTLNRQGWDIETQYRSVIFYHNEDQKEKALASKEKLEAEHRFANPIVTEIKPATAFYPAEEYHQKYYEKSGRIIGKCNIF